ncbi:ATP-dependent Clp protease ATP-binding subunit ClpX [Frankliniella fusca]|uniref:ATP-dependent Clp protease ATP-binding subunit ClpX n=1 Tax=Frankliniella fusca TaxID=407009 RepID=A0AAE1GXQ4_9NEOP|nr:ATP-dependent Clp protease ATP-binding subunit ClpX [Frankliniella fusca]
METIPHLDKAVNEFHDNFQQQKVDKNKYLLELREVIDLYLLSVMEEEDNLYRVLHLRAENVCNDYNDLKTVSPFNVQLNILMSLPLHPSDIQVEKGDIGFIKIKLPSNIEERVQFSKIWRDACNCGVQKSLLRHLNLWKDDDNYLKSTAFLKWFSGAVNKSLEVTGEIPNYKIVRLETDSNVTLRIRDERNHLDIYVTLRPVFLFPISMLPNDCYCQVSQDTECNEWIAECFSNEVSDPQLWATSLWQHEKLVIETHDLKPSIRILKGVRDIHCQKNQDLCEWNLLTNNHIRNLVMVLHKSNEVNFQNSSGGKLLLDLLLQLRNKLVSREGLQYFWDEKRNLLCGLTGAQKSSLARLVTRSIRDLQDPNCHKFLSLETYVSTQNSSESSSSESFCESARSSSEQTSSNYASYAHLCDESLVFEESRGGTSQGAKLDQVLKGGNKDYSSWWIVGGIAATLAPLAIAAISKGALTPKKRQNKDD